VPEFIGPVNEQPKLIYRSHQGSRTIVIP
jgi:hypothetical protein